VSSLGIVPNATNALNATTARTAVTGGGASVGDEDSGLVNDSYANSKGSWVADFFNYGGQTGTESITATVTAIFPTAATTAPLQPIRSSSKCGALLRRGPTFS
jgi:hypothetical protein